MACYFKTSNFAVGDELRAEEIKEAVQAIEQYYNPEGSCKAPFEVDHVFVPTDKGGFVLEDINSETGKPLTEEESKLYKEYLIASSDFESEECWNKIWDTIKLYGQGWWN